MSVTSAGNLKEQERQEQNRFASLFIVSPRRGLNGGRVDLNDLLTSNGALLSLLVHDTNVLSGPVIEIIELTIKGYKIGRTAYEIDSSLYNINAV